MAKTRATSRRRGVGSITKYETSAGIRWRWQIRIPLDLENPSGGSKQSGQAGYLTMQEADDALQAFRRLTESQKAAQQSGIPTVGDFASEWLKGLRLENSTIYGYEKIVRNHIAPYLGRLRLDQVTPTRIARHYKELQDHGRKDSKALGAGLSANTVNKVHVTLGAIFDAAVSDGYISTNPARQKRTVNAPTGKHIRAQKVEMQTWTAEQLQMFLNWDRDSLQDELYPLWHLIAHTGMRRSEALALKWTDIDQAHARISVRRAADVTRRNVEKTTKTGRARVVDIDQKTVDVLKAWKAVRGSLSLDLARPEAYVFGNVSGEMRSPNEVGARWSYRITKAREELGEDNLPRLTIHGLRHTHATLLMSIGEHPKIVQERLGHSDISTTMNTYSHVTPTMQRDAVERLSRLFS